MKQVINLEPINTVDVNNTSHDNYYGIFFPLSGNYGIVTRESFNQGVYKIICPINITRGSNFPSYKETTLSRLLKAVLNDNPKNQIFEFDSPSELFTWLGSQLP